MRPVINPFSSLLPFMFILRIFILKLFYKETVPSLSKKGNFPYSKNLEAIIPSLELIFFRLNAQCISS